MLLLVLPAPSAAQSMFTDFKARKAGDVITVVLQERTAAQRASEWENAASTNRNGEGGVSSSGSLSGTFGLDARYAKASDSRNESVQSDLLRGIMTAVIQEVDAGGNLRIEGERRLNVNGETHVMKVHGLVRRSDVRTDNTVMSYQIANATIEYTRAGGIGRSLKKPGRLVRIGGLIVLGAAAAFGATAATGN